MKSAVLVMDVQQGLFQDEPRPFMADETLQVINQLTDKARENDVPIIFIQHEVSEGPLMHGTKGWEIEAGLTVADKDILVRKTTPDSFFKTNLQDLLNEMGIENLIICGYATEYCVDTTIRRSAALGYSVQIIADGHTTHDKDHANGRLIIDHHNVTLSNIRSFGPKIEAIKLEEFRF